MEICGIAKKTELEEKALQTLCFWGEGEAEWEKETGCEREREGEGTGGRGRRERGTRGGGGMARRTESLGVRVLRFGPGPTVNI